MNEKEFAKIYTLIESLKINMNKKEDDLKNQINEKDQLIKELNCKLLNQENRIKENENEIKSLNIKIERLTKENNNELKDNKNKINIINNLISNQEKKLNEIYNKNISTLKNSNENIQILFQSDEFNLDINEFKTKFKKYNKFKELLNLKEIQLDIIMGPCKLTKNQLDGRGNKYNGWSSGENRGGKPYIPPIGWIGIGLRVWDRYDGVNDWLGHDNNPGEWCAAYHGVASGWNSNDVKKIVGLIYKNGFKPGCRQAHSECSDINHPGKEVGIGIACSPSIHYAEMYAGISNINGINYKTVIMVRVKPSAIRTCHCTHDNWIVNSDEIRPYRILYKKCD